ncbi:MAG TPA: hypothetical protein VE421_11175 [Burkholderiaceae bacterium]|nr:hypothetical protein [Burkholderiaceae bacterium]
MTQKFICRSAIVGRAVFYAARNRKSDRSMTPAGRGASLLRTPSGLWVRGLLVTSVPVAGQSISETAS